MTIPNLRIALFFSLGFFLFACNSNQNANSSSERHSMIREEVKKGIPYPIATQKPKTLSIHGDERQDPFYWLNERENPEVIDYLNAENAYLDTIIAPLNPFREKLYNEIVGRIKQTDMSVPYLKNGYYYITRYEEGKEYPIYSRKKGSLDAEEEILLNVNELAKGFSYYQVGGRSISPDNKKLVYSEDTLSRRIYTLRIKDLTTGELLPDVIPNTSGGAVWAETNNAFFYATKDETLRQNKIWLHTIGLPVSSDKLIYEEKDPTFVTYVYKTLSSQYIVIGSRSTLTTEYRILDATTPQDPLQVFEPRTRGVEYDIEHKGTKWYVHTNWEATNFRLMETPEKKTSRENWKEVIPNRDAVLLEGVSAFKDYLVLNERKGGLTQLRIIPDDGEPYYMEFDEDAYVVGLSVNENMDTEILRIGYESMTTPNSTFDVNMRTREKTLLKQQEVVGDFSSDNYVSKRIMVNARDGVEIPVSIVYHKDTPIDGTSPCLLYGYGSYGYSLDPSFNSARLSLLDRGFVWAIAHIRGGEEMGRHWYENGKLLKKKNTFTDFIDVGKGLKELKYAAPDQLFAMGGSAGGLLMGSVINMEPALWAGVIAQVPFVDVVTTMLDESIPLTTGEFDEWGNPKDAEYYNYIKSYSPYDNIEKKAYPPLLVTTGLHDSQVQYWEPAKWVAKLRTMKTDSNPLLLYTNMDTGHGGASGRFEKYKELAMEYAFLLDLAGKANN